MGQSKSKSARDGVNGTRKHKKANKKLTPEELDELETRTYCTFPPPMLFFTRKELRKWYKDFVRDCPSGELKLEEFQNIYKQFFPNGDPSKFASFVFNVFDDNNDGHISFKGVHRRPLDHFAGDTRREARLGLQSFTTLIKDGFITKAEMANIVDAIYSMIGSMLELPKDKF
ncbi:CBN-NCS-3 protein [Aphelenchoides fujianensis]|nr:CBN-NCS-3 protein [Aphelenchoides fujianensis]